MNVSKSSKASNVKGMSLTSKGGKNKSLEEALYKEDKLAPVLLNSKQSIAESVSTIVSPPIMQHPLMLVIAEKVSASLTRDGMVDSFEIKGSLTLTALNDTVANCSVQLKIGESGDFVFNTHPKVNKSLYDKSQLLQLKDTTKGFPSERPVGILRWSYASTNDELVPLTINCWPEEESRGQMNVSIEYTLEKKIDLHDVRIHIPLGASDNLSIVSVDGSYKHHQQNNELIWELQLIDKSNPSGSLEFTISQKNSDAFFPITVQFSSQQLFCNVDILSVTAVDSGKPIQYGSSKNLSTDEYFIN